MNKKIDHLFRNKLREQQLTPPPAAWNKIQHQLNNKKQQKSFIYYKIASVCLFLLISAITFKMWNTDSILTINSNKEVAGNINKPHEKESNVLVEDSSINDNSQAPEIITKKEELYKPSQQLAENELNNELNRKKKLNLHRYSGNKPHTPQKEDESVEFEPEIEILLVDNKSEPAKITADTNGFSEITITYKRGNSVNTSTMNENTEVATVVNNDKTTVQKLIKIAKELKVSEINLADIRDSKEDLFSMEIMKLKN